MDASPADMTDRHARILGRLAELGMSLAEKMHADAMTAETPEQTGALAAGFHRLSRSVRQSLALEARLTRDAARLRREAELEFQARAAAQPARRRAEAKARLDRLVWTEAEDLETARDWTQGSRLLLAEAEFGPDFETADVGALVETIAAQLRDRYPPGKPSGEAQVNEWRWIIVDPDGTETVVGEKAKAKDPPPEAQRPDPCHDPPRGLPGEFGPNGETGDDRRFDRIL